MINQSRVRKPAVQPGLRSRSDRPLLVLAGLASLLFGGLAAAWIIAPGLNPFGRHDSGFAPDQSLLNQLIGPAGTAITLLTAGLLGTAVTAVLMHRGLSGLWPLPVIGFGAVQAVVIGIGMLNETVIMSAGYLMAVGVVIAAAVLVVQLVRKYPVGRWLALGVVAVIVLIFATGLMPVAALIELSILVAGLTGQLGAIGLLFGLCATALSWLLVAGRVAQRHRLLDRPGRWLLRHRRVITVLAALGPLPYCLVRLSWLTPWPYGGADELTPDIRIWGVLLSAGGWAGALLTLGLIQRWGEIFPRWMPFLAGRPVPVWFAAGPGSFVAAVLIVSAIPMLRSFATEGLADGLLSLVIFPFWAWGPMLALAVWGYVLHRRVAGSGDGERVAQRV